MSAKTIAKKYSKYLKFKSAGKREENKELIIHSAIALTIRLAGAGAAFVMNVIIARYLGASQAGYFFLAVSITSLIASIGRIGADQTILRFVGLHSASEEWEQIHAVMRKMMSWTYIPLIILTFLICIFSKQIAIYFFHKEALQWPLFWTSLAMPFYAGYNVHGMALQGRKKVFWSVVTLRILTPAFLILFVLIYPPADVSGVSVYYMVACILNLVLGYYWWNKSVPSSKNRITFDSKVLWQSSFPLWISSIMNQLTMWGGQLVAGIFLDSIAVAQLAVARNTTVLVSFILLAVNNVSAPRFAAMYSQGKMNQLKNYARHATFLMTLVALPITLIIFIVPDTIMSLFGKDFTEAVWLLRILALGQFVNVITGSVGSLLIMSGHEKDMRNIRIFNGVLSIVLALILTPLFGTIGSALSSAISMACFNLMAVGQVKKRLGFSTMSIFGFK
jgi:O-antigen/teichoic acid export membrane protein